MPKDAYYFTHDCNASHDPKILMMRSVYGAEGYGWYWMLVEQMRQQDNYKLPINGKYALNALASDFNANVDKLSAFVSDCVCEFNLFVETEGLLWSESLVKRMEKLDDKREKARQSALTRWGNQAQKNANALETDANAPKNDASKVNKSKVNKSIPPIVPQGTGDFELPLWINKSFWDSFMVVRKKLKAVQTPDALSKIVQRLENLKKEGNDPNQVLEQSIMNSWKGVFPLKSGGQYGKQIDVAKSPTQFSGKYGTVKEHLGADYQDPPDSGAPADAE
jgi:hypothetical protein